MTATVFGRIGFTDRAFILRIEPLSRLAASRFNRLREDGPQSVSFRTGLGRVADMAGPRAEARSLASVIGIALPVPGTPGDIAFAAAVPALGLVVIPVGIVIARGMSARQGRDGNRLGCVSTASPVRKDAPRDWIAHHITSLIGGVGIGGSVRCGGNRCANDRGDRADLKQRLHAGKVAENFAGLAAQGLGGGHAASRVSAVGRLRGFAAAYSASSASVACLAATIPVQCSAGMPSRCTQERAV